jgi:hypothetical protein
MQANIFSKVLMHWLFDATAVSPIMQFLLLLLHHEVAAWSLSTPMLVLTQVELVPDPLLSRY